MLLAVDVGNTQTVVGVFETSGPLATTDGRPPGEVPGLVRSWRAATVAERTADEHALLLSQLLGLDGLRVRGTGGPGASEDPGGRGLIEGIVFCSSVPAVTVALRETAARWFDVPLVVVEPGVRTGMPVLYDNPREVGADRIADAVAALDLFEPPIVVVDLGTATTFDAISAAGEYLGGAIVPGIEISMQALCAAAAALPRVALGEPRRAIGRSTVESMQVGAVFGHAALVDGMCERLEQELGDATVVATGGLGGVVAPHSRKVQHLEPWLTLHGLRLLYLRNTGRDADAPRR